MRNPRNPTSIGLDVLPVSYPLAAVAFAVDGPPIKSAKPGDVVSLAAIRDMDDFAHCATSASTGSRVDASMIVKQPHS